MINFKIHKQMCMVLAVVISSIMLIGCSKMLYPPEWGERLEYKGSSLFYTQAVTETEAGKLGDYLLETGFFQTEHPGTVQITKEGGTYQFRMVIKDEKEIEVEFLNLAAMFAAEISRDVFEGKQVEVHLCDKDFKTLRVTTYQFKEEIQEE
ncbi:MAG: hypothetical protein ABIC18_02000 [Candidatus Omnitrophota bacterium]